MMLRDWLVVTWYLVRPALYLVLCVTIAAMMGIAYLTARDRQCTACFRSFAVYRGIRCKRCRLPKGVRA